MYVKVTVQGADVGMFFSSSVCVDVHDCLLISTFPGHCGLVPCSHGLIPWSLCGLIPWLLWSDSMLTLWLFSQADTMRRELRLVTMASICEFLYYMCI